ncbi:MAG: hypothetical protein HKN45_07390, partial [Flavobacteriales bacterium]|nr:hypothetical protein [Flavobacteriales bacterium]
MNFKSQSIPHSTERNSEKVKGEIKVIFLLPYPIGYGPSQRFRAEIYFGQLESNGIRFHFHSFLGEDGYQKLYKAGDLLSKILAMIKGQLRRLAILQRIREYDVVFIQREASPLGPAIIEWVIAKVLKKPIIYDIDDAIWMPNVAEANARFHWLKSFRKIDKLMSWSRTVIAGNDFLAQRALMFNRDVIVIPTIVDTVHYHSLTNHVEDKSLTLGWTGT